jgi:hypothetical protein
MKRKTIILLLLVYSLLIFLTLNRHSKSGIQNYHSEIWSDKAGYYVYLPAFFIYDFEADKLPSEIDKKTGDGFFITNGVVKTKYTYGVALLQSPFFIIGHLLSTKLGYENDGFSIIYCRMIDIASVTYSFIALIFLYLFLVRYVSEKISLLTILCVFLGTNTFYYSIFETGMSHIYSFFICTCLLYLSPLPNKPNQRKLHYILFGSLIGILLAIRPINIIFLPFLFLFNKINFQNLKIYIKPLSIIGCSVILILLPQFIYWNYAFGNYFQYAYTNEGFTNLLSPRILHLWFSPHNGFFIYSPLVIFMLIGIYYLKEYSGLNKILILGYFLFFSVIFAAWHDWTYGCSYGCRPYVEYFSILSLPFAFFLERVSINKYTTFIFGFILLLFIGYNQKLIFSYDGCWYGGDWDWQEWWRLVVSKTK